MAGLGSLFGYQSGTNPFLDFLQGHSNTLLGLGAGLAGGGPDLGQAVGQALTLAGQGKTADFAQSEKLKADAQLADQQNKTLTWLRQNAPKYADAVANGVMSPADAWKAVIADQGGTQGADPSSVAEYKFYANQETQGGRQPLSYADWRKGSNQTLRAGVGQPIWGKNRTTGEYKPFEPMSDGTISSLTDPNADPKDFIFDPGTVASDKAAGSAYGTAQGGGQFNLPAAKQNIDLEMANIDAIANDQQGLDQIFGNVAGIPQQWLPTMPGTPKANIQARVAQVVGQNFLQAYSSLKGAGAITEVEGAKAQDAMGRLSTAQSKDAFLQALNDLKAVLKIGYDRMATQATMGPYQSTGYTPPPLAGKNYVYDPASGELVPQ